MGRDAAVREHDSDNDTQPHRSVSQSSSETPKAVMPHRQQRRLDLRMQGIAGEILAWIFKESRKTAEKSNTKPRRTRILNGEPDG